MQISDRLALVRHFAELRRLSRQRNPQRHGRLLLLVALLVVTTACVASTVTAG